MYIIIKEELKEERKTRSKKEERNLRLTWDQHQDFAFEFELKKISIFIKMYKRSGNIYRSGGHNGP